VTNSGSVFENHRLLRLFFCLGIVSFVGARKFLSSNASFTHATICLSCKSARYFSAKSDKQWMANSKELGQEIIDEFFVIFIRFFGGLLFFCIFHLLLSRKE
jgi:hypothetical protein